MQKKVKSFDGLRINYDITRNSNLFLIFIHGVGGNMKVWDIERRFFHAHGFSTLALDIRGHGKSDRPNKVDDYKIENFAKDVQSIIKKEKIKAFIPIGHCFGGMVAMMFHKLCPKSAEAYILIDTSYKAPQKLNMIFEKSSRVMSTINKILENRTTKKNFEYMDYTKYVGSCDWDIVRLYNDITHTSLKSWLFTHQNFARFNGLDILKNIDKNVLIIYGKNDSFFKVLEAEEVGRLIKKATVKIVPKANHIIVINNPNTLVSEILPFVEQIAKRQTKVI